MLHFRFLINAAFVGGCFVASAYETWTDYSTGIAWKYTVKDGGVVLQNGQASCISAQTTGKITVPERVGGYPVKGIGDFAFAQCSCLHLINLPSQIKSIGRNAFYNCVSLEEIDIPANVESIGDWPFLGCVELKRIGVASENKVFKSVDGCVLSKDGRSYLFSPCTFQHAVIPEGVTRIGDTAFYGMEKLLSVQLPTTIEEIGYNAFCECEKLTDVRSIASVKVVNMHAFSQCRALTNVDLSACQAVGVEAFRDCSKLNCVTLSREAKVDRSAFAGCHNVQHLKIGQVNQLDLFDTIGLKSILFMEGVDKIPDNACSNAVSLSSVTIPSSVTDIGDYAFYGTSISTVTFPSGLRTIGEGAFGDCANLNRVVVPWTTSVAENAFQNDVCVARPVNVCILGGEWRTVYDGREKQHAYNPASDRSAYDVKENVRAKEMTAGIKCGTYRKLLDAKDFQNADSHYEVAFSIDPDQNETPTAPTFTDAGTYSVWYRITAANIVFNLPSDRLLPPPNRRLAGWAGSNGRRYDPGVLVFNLVPDGGTITLTAI